MQVVKRPDSLSTFSPKIYPMACMAGLPPWPIACITIKVYNKEDIGVHQPRNPPQASKWSDFSSCKCILGSRNPAQNNTSSSRLLVQPPIGLGSTLPLPSSSQAAVGRSGCASSQLNHGFQIQTESPCQVTKSQNGATKSLKSGLQLSKPFNNKK